MKMNRRNVLFVLGTTILLGGALIASGAFSQVEATRDVTVETTGDADAALGIELNSTNYDNSDYVSNGSNGEAISLEFTDVNNNATIYFDDLLDITNNGENSVDINVTSAADDGIMVYTGEESNFEPDNIADGNVLDTDDSEQIGIAINTSTFEQGDDNTITIEANRP